MKNHPSPSLPRHLSGLTLIELMIAMVLGLIVMAGVLYIFQGSKQSFRQGDTMARLQENGRIALESITNDLRMTSYAGCASIASLAPESLVSSPTISFSDETVVSGRGYAAGDSLVTNGVPGSNIVTIKHISEQIVRLAQSMDSKASDIVLTKTEVTPKFKVGDIATIGTCERMNIFRVTGVAEGSDTITLSHAAGTSTGNTTNELGFALKFQQLARIGHLVEQTYYVKDTGRTNAAGNPIRGLFRIATVNGSSAGTEEELAEGVENLLVSYGLDTDGDGDVDSYKATSAMTTSDWLMTLSARVEMLVASAEDRAVEAAQPYTFNGTTTTPTDRKMRTSVGATITLRNRVHL